MNLRSRRATLETRVRLGVAIATIEASYVTSSPPWTRELDWAKNNSTQDPVTV
jgi:hypothetical protein